jgi:hypothetical protein
VSSTLFPTLPGLAFPVKREVTYKTLNDESLSRRVGALALQQYAVRQWALPFSVLRDNLSPSELRTLHGFFNSLRGRYDSFLYLDPIYNTVTVEPFGTGDGLTRAFQMIATFKNAGGPGGPDIIQNFVSLPTLFINGGAPSPYVLGPSGIVTFTTAPSPGDKLTWSGSFYYRCHFMDDTMELTQFMNQLWAPAKDGIKFRQRLL